MSTQIPSSSQTLVDENKITTSFWYIFFQNVYKSLRANLPASLSGVLSFNYTPASNINAGATDLMSYSLPANMMKNNGDYLEIEAWGTFGANANNKRVTLNFGSQTIFDTGTSAINGGSWSFSGKVSRISATSQKINTTGVYNNLAQSQPTTGTQDLAQATIIKCVGTGVSSNDITQESLVIKITPND